MIHSKPPVCARCTTALMVVLWALTACQTEPPTPPSSSHAPQPAVTPVVPPGVPPRVATVHVLPQPTPRPIRLGLALGGGAARGFAHIGALQVLEEAGIRPHVVVGTSAGSLVAALYASGRSAQDLAALALTMDEGALTDWAFPSRGVIRGEALARYVREQTQGRTIEAMPMALGIVATDLDSGAPVLMRQGDTGTAVRASSAVPAVFQPVKVDGREYVDGGLVAPVPVRFARHMGADVVVAIDISSPPDGNPTGDSVKLLMQTVAILMRSLNRWELEQADVVLRPSLVGVVSSDFNSRVRALRAGREAAAPMVERIKARLAAAALEPARPATPAR